MRSCRPALSRALPAPFAPVAALGLVAGLALGCGQALAQQPFSWAGHYDGYVTCDHVQDGVASTFAMPFQLLVAQDGDTIRIGTRTANPDETGAGLSIYEGRVMGSPDGGFVSGFVEACRPRFAYRELVRMFPASTDPDRFAFSASTIFVTESMPEAEGALVVESCRWSATRTSMEAPTLEPCAAAADR